MEYRVVTVDHVHFVQTVYQHHVAGNRERERERNVLFNDALNTFYLRLYGNVLFNDALNTFYLRLYGVSTTQIVREETCSHHMSYSFRLAASSWK